MVLSVEHEPVVEFYNWRIVEAEDTKNRHLIGDRGRERTDRITSALVHFDKGSMTVTTSSGRRYVLNGGPGVEGDKLGHPGIAFMWTAGVKFKDVTEEYLK